jgi:hypothetical protein
MFSYRSAGGLVLAGLSLVALSNLSVGTLVPSLPLGSDTLLYVGLVYSITGLGGGFTIFYSDRPLAFYEGLVLTAILGGVILWHEAQVRPDLFLSSGYLRSTRLVFPPLLGSTVALLIPVSVARTRTQRLVSAIAVPLPALGYVAYSGVNGSLAGPSAPIVIGLGAATLFGGVVLGVPISLGRIVAER